MGWNEIGNITGGVWNSWTPLFQTGTDLWDASSMTYNDCRWTYAEGIVYATGNFVLDNGTNYGNGTDHWQLWLPSEMPHYVDTDAGGRIMGAGQVYSNSLASNPPTANFSVVAVNTFNSFVSFPMHRYVGTGGDWNFGKYDTLTFNRSGLSSLGSGVYGIYCSWYMRYIAEPSF